MAKKQPIGNLLKAGHEQKQEQARLRTEYNLGGNVTVVEKKSTAAQIIKAVLNFLLSLLRIVAWVAIGVLATVGLATLVYPDIRAAFFAAAKDVWELVREFLGM